MEYILECSQSYLNLWYFPTHLFDTQQIIKSEIFSKKSKIEKIFLGLLLRLVQVMVESMSIIMEQILGKKATYLTTNGSYSMELGTRIGTKLTMPEMV